LARKTVLLLLALLLPAGVGASGAPMPLPAAVQQAPVALLVDLSAGQTLYARNAERRLLPASMTKAMTALLAFDLIAAGELDENAEVAVRPETAAQWAGQGTSLYLKPGQKVRVRELLLGVTTVSANDASVALAEAALGSTAAWTARMNQRAASLGMRGSAFRTPNGWPDGGKTYVTARDMVRLARALIHEHPQLYRRYFGHRAMDWQGQRFPNHDPFAGVVTGADGIKTGFTNEAGFSYLGTARRDGQRLVLVLAGVENGRLRARLAKAYVEWGFAAFERRQLFAPGAVVGKARVQNGAARSIALRAAGPIAINLPKGSDARLAATIRYDGPLRAPIAAGQEVAMLEVTARGVAPARIPLYAAAAVDKAGPLDRIVNALAGIFS